MHAVEFIDKHVRFAVLEFGFGTPLDVFTHAGIGFLEVDFLFRFIFSGKTRGEAFGLEWPDQVPGLRFWRNQKLRQLFVQRRGDSEMPKRAPGF